MQPRLDEHENSYISFCWVCLLNSSTSSSRASRGNSQVIIGIRSKSRFFCLIKWGPIGDRMGPIEEKPWERPERPVCCWGLPSKSSKQKPHYSFCPRTSIGKFGLHSPRREQIFISPRVCLKFDLQTRSVRLLISFQLVFQLVSCRFFCWCPCSFLLVSCRFPVGVLLVSSFLQKPSRVHPKGPQGFGPHASQALVRRAAGLLWAVPAGGAEAGRRAPGPAASHGGLGLQNGWPGRVLFFVFCFSGSAWGGGVGGLFSAVFPSWFLLSAGFGFPFDTNQTQTLSKSTHTHTNGRFPKNVAGTPQTTLLVSQNGWFPRENMAGPNNKAWLLKVVGWSVSLIRNQSPFHGYSVSFWETPQQNPTNERRFGQHLEKPPWVWEGAISQLSKANRPFNFMVFKFWSIFSKGPKRLTFYFWVLWATESWDS